MAPAKRKALSPLTGIRYGFTKDLLQRCLHGLDFEALSVTTKAPRLLSCTNTDRYSGGAYGAVWRVMDAFDTWRDQRAWIEVCCRLLSSRA